jgi:tRNA(Ile)-lysidine synthase
VRAVQSSGTIAPGDAIVVAVSGGADSTALLHVLWRLREPWNLRLTAAHFDHGLRGDASRRDAEAVASLCRGLGVALATGRAGPLHGPSLEAAARRARYAFLARVALGQGASKVAVAHHRDDQAETVLLRLLRGAGAEGLAGMRPVRPLASGVTLVRPLLAVGGEEVRAHCAAHGLPVREDETNRDLRFARNRIRHVLLPLLEREYQPGCRDALARAARLLADDDEWLVRQAAEAFARLRRGAALDAAGLAALPAAVARRVIRLWWREACGRHEALAFEHVEALRLGREVDLPGGRHATSAGGLLRLLPGRRRQTFAYALTLPGAADVPEAGVRVTARLSATAPQELPSPSVAAGDADAVAAPLTVRSRRPGDRFRPLGAPGTRKLQDVLVDARVPREERDRIPVIADAEGRILWVPGVRQADHWRLGPGVRRVLVLTVEPMTGAEGDEGDAW